MDPPRRLGRLPARLLPGGVRLAEARSAGERGRGLAGLAAIGPDDALLISGCRSVHTFWMRFPLDLIWLDAHGGVLAIALDVPPRRLCFNPRARALVEAPAGQGGRVAAALRASELPGRGLSSLAT